MAQAEDALRSGDALILVDIQNDFCPGGALPIEEGDQIVALANRWIAAARDKGIPVYASRDWHPAGHPSFDSEGGQWPQHCLQDTSGAAFHPKLDVPADAILVTKGTRFDKDQYSAFDGTGLGDELRKRGIKRVWVAGLALDVCVRATALDAARGGFETHLIEEGTRPVTAQGGKDALAEMRRAGVVIES
jgi:nicotinamidase/pyrazinamidase